ncbi:MAG: hypothetical protein JST89_19245 [Cyanobacteria bacterium SZAS-4]|nr:hypothetical protein [Cyanobacteria bacterium SZAS-4]
MNTPADNSVPSYLMGDASETLFHIKQRGDDSETGNWLSSLVNDALEIAAHGDAEEPVNDEDVDLMVRWVAQIFNEFELYKIEFNKKASGSDLIVNASALNLGNLSPSNDRFEGHLSTRFWSLAFDASTRKLDVYLIPADLVLAFTTNRIDETEYTPFITFTPRRQMGEYFWSVNQQRITFDMLPKLAKELFGDLIKVASGNVTEEEFFNNASHETAVQEIAPPTDRSYESDPASAAVFESAAKSGAGSLGAGFVGSVKPVGSVRAAVTVGSEVAADTKGGGVAPGDSSDEFSAPPEIQSPRSSALTEEFFQMCSTFSTSLDSEMKAVIEFARNNPEDIELLKNCKQILIEMDALRVSSLETAKKLRALQS